MCTWSPPVLVGRAPGAERCNGGAINHKKAKNVRNHCLLRKKEKKKTCRPDLQDLQANDGDVYHLKGKPAREEEEGCYLF